MFIEKYGTGSKAYFGLHGWGGSHLTFEPLVEHLPGDAALYSADLPGIGRSPAPRRWNLEVIAEEIATAMTMIKGGEVTLIGNCSGAILGLLAAAYIAGRINRFVLIDPFAYMPWYFKLFVKTRFGRIAYNTTFANPVGRKITNISLKRRRSPESDLTGSFGSVNHEATYRYLSLMGGLDSVERFGWLNMPTDIAYGENTFHAVKRSIAIWQRLWPHARCLELAGAGHLPIIEATRQLGEIIFSVPTSAPPRINEKRQSAGRISR